MSLLTYKDGNLLECLKFRSGKLSDINTVKPVLSTIKKRRPKIGFQDRLLVNAGQKYCRMLQWEHSAILLTIIWLPFFFKTVLSMFEWKQRTSMLLVLLGPCCSHATKQVFLLALNFLP